MTSFILESRRGATHRARRVLLAALSAVAVSLTLAAIAFVQYRRSESERRAAVSERLAAESVRARLERRPQRAILLGVAAVRVRTREGEPASIEAFDALYQAGAGIGGMPVAWNPSSIEAVAVYGDDVVIWGSDDGLLRIRRREDQKSAPSVVAHKNGVTTVVTATAAPIVVSAGHDRTVRVWHRDGMSLQETSTYTHPDRIRTIRITADGMRLTTASWDGHIAVHELDGDGKIVRTQSVLVADAMDATTDPAGQWVFAIDAKGAVSFIDRRSSPVSPITVATHSSGGTSVTVSPDGRWLATSGLGHDVILFDLADARGPTASRRTLRGHESSVFALAFRADSRWLATGSDDGTARLWDLAAAESKAPIILTGHTDAVRSVTFIPGERLRIATGSTDRTVRVWMIDSETGSLESKSVLHAHDEVVTGVVAEKSGRGLITAGRDGMVRRWDLDLPEPGGGMLAQVFPAHRDEVRSLAISADGRRVVTSDFSGTACSWTFDPIRYQCRPSPLPSRDRLGTVPCPERDEFLVRGRRGALALCGFSHERCKALAALDANIMTAACSSVRIAAADAKGRVFVWDETNGSWLRRSLTPVHAALPLALQLSPDSRLLASGDQAGNVLMWRDRSTMAEELSGHTDGVAVLAFSGASDRLLSAGFDVIGREWNVSRPRATLVRRLEGHTQSPVAPLGITAAVYDTAGRFVATSGVDGTVRIWPAGRGRAVGASTVLSGHEPGTFGHGVKSLALANGWLASGGEDGVVRLWDINGDEPALTGATLLGHTRAVRAVEFALDGSQIVTASEDGTIRIWPITLEHLLQRACAIAGRDMSGEERTRYFGNGSSGDVCP